MPAIQRLRLVHGSLVRFAEIVEAPQRVLDVLVGARGEGVKAAAHEIEQLVLPNVADGAQLAAITEARAQQRGERIAAAVDEAREVDRDEREAIDVAQAL